MLGCVYAPVVLNILFQTFRSRGGWARQFPSSPYALYIVCVGGLGDRHYPPTFQTVPITNIVSGYSVATPPCSYHTGACARCSLGVATLWPSSFSAGPRVPPRTTAFFLEQGAMGEGARRPLPMGQRGWPRAACPHRWEQKI